MKAPTEAPTTGRVAVPGLVGEAPAGPEGAGVPAPRARARWPRGETVFSLVLIALALYVLFDTSRYPPSIMQGAPGPALFPRVLAAALLVLNAVLLASGRKAAAPPREAASPEGLRRVGVMLLILLGFLVLAARADFFVLVFVMLAAVTRVAGEERTLVILLLPALFVVFMYVVFFRAFAVPFPTNLL